jgi:lipoate-protein ligase A
MSRDSESSNHPSRVSFDEPFFTQLILHLDGTHPGPMNMAVDQAWLEQSKIPVLRVYTWDQPTVTLGYAQSLPKLQDALPGWPVVRRWTGGGVVLHQGDYTYSVIVPPADPWSETTALESYRRIHGSLAEALSHNGHPGCRLALQEDVIEAPFCFVAPAVHDVIRGPVKVAGAGQRRGKLGLLHQGSIQQVILTPDFWPQWAARLSKEVVLVNTTPDSVRDRAIELEQNRYSLPQWLTDRDDLIPR